jgi:orotate phosphoribosyltransferase
VQEVSADFGLRCVSIITLADLIAAAGGAAGAPVAASLEALKHYRDQYGVTD